MDPQNLKWKNVYEFDVPVLHAQRVVSSNKPTARDAQNENESLSEPKKLFHRFTEQEIENVIDQV